eukprot:4521682-Pleurochrysis_carterae.AAC.2
MMLRILLGAVKMLGTVRVDAAALVTATAAPAAVAVTAESTMREAAAAQAVGRGPAEHCA